MSTKKLQVIGLKYSGGSGIPEEQLKQIQDDIAKKLDKTGHPANVYLGTDVDGNIIYKLEPTTTSTADSAFSLTSEFPVQNKVVTAKFNEISDKVKKLEEQPVSSYDEIYVGSGDMPEGYTLQIDPEAESDEMIDEYARGQLGKLSEAIANLKSNITLGKHTDGLVYVFIDGKPVGSGLNISGGTVETVDDITLENNIMTILALANEPTLTDGVLTIA